MYAGTGAGLATFGAILAGWKIRRSFVRADTAVHARPHSAALRRLTVRFPDQVATDALRLASELQGASPAALVPHLRPGDCVWFISSSRSREWARAAANAARPIVAGIFSTDRDEAFPTPPWGAWRHPPSGAGASAGDAAHAFEVDLGVDARWAPRGLTALDGVRDSPAGIQARTAALESELTLWALVQLARLALEDPAHWRTDAPAIQHIDELVAACGAHWVQAPESTATTTEGLVLSRVKRMLVSFPGELRWARSELARRVQDCR